MKIFEQLGIFLHQNSMLLLLQPQFKATNIASLKHRNIDNLKRFVFLLFFVSEVQYLAFRVSTACQYLSSLTNANHSRRENWIVQLLCSHLTSMLIISNNKKSCNRPLLATQRHTIYADQGVSDLHFFQNQTSPQHYAPLQGAYKPDPKYFCPSSSVGGPSAQSEMKISKEIFEGQFFLYI